MKKRAQSLSEYVVALGVIVAAVVGMQLYLQRNLQAKHAAGIKYWFQKAGLENKVQYEPYYYTASAGRKSTDLDISTYERMHDQRLKSEVHNDVEVSGYDYKDFRH